MQDGETQWGGEGDGECGFVCVQELCHTGSSAGRPQASEHFYLRSDENQVCDAYDAAIATWTLVHDDVLGLKIKADNCAALLWAPAEFLNLCTVQSYSIWIYNMEEFWSLFMTSDPDMEVAVLISLETEDSSRFKSYSTSFMNLFLYVLSQTNAQNGIKIVLTSSLKSNNKWRETLYLYEDGISVHFCYLFI